ncbi:hypothetical protein FOL47_005938 [Perkinsus chesapeaki]|uniref:Tryptophan synthase beta chain-like PALP domain-containing protein n=1 Tax=Perkinsus chesapeaki TaxID=330153 RepID=A0A7J6LUP7_PERCH|nr:hypothetical protein FOL47_005938 [Perkinsus chesapeaki]
MPEKMSGEKINMMKALGAEILRTPNEAAWNSPESHIGLAIKLQKKIPRSHILDQYLNPANPMAHYEGTGAEIVEQCDGKVDVMVLGAGTGGTITGVARKLKDEFGEKCRVVGVDPVGSILAVPDSLNDPGRLQGYQVEGIGYDFIPTVLDRDPSVIDEWMKVGDGEALGMARKLIRLEGLTVGGSSGTCVAAAVRYIKSQKREDMVGKRVVALLPDSSRNYMSKFLDDGWMLAHGFIGFEELSTFNLYRQKPWGSVTVKESGIVLSKMATVESRMTAAEAIKTINAAHEKDSSFSDQVGLVKDSATLVEMVTVANLYARLTAADDPKSITVEKCKHKPTPLTVGLESSLAEVATKLDVQTDGFSPLASRNMAAVVVYVVCMLVFGALNTLIGKIQFQTVSVGIDGEKHLFTKPWFNTFSMFMGMSLSIVAHLISVAIKRRSEGQKVDQEEPLLHHDEARGGPPHSNPMIRSLVICLPAALDLSATVMCFVGLLYNPASVWQMLRGAEIIFCAILSVCFLGRKLHAYHWGAVALCVVAILIVGFSNLMSSGESTPAGEDPALMLFGMAMIVGGQVVQAGQVVCEERLLKVWTVSPLQLVGMEGLWGCVLMIFIAFPVLQRLPGQDRGSLENTMDTFEMLKNNPQLVANLIIYFVSILSYNISGVMVTYKLTAVHRTMIEASRTAVIWTVDLLIHYVILPGSEFGERWTSWSWLQLVGFVLLTYSQAAYSDVVKLPWFDYPRS